MLYVTKNRELYIRSVKLSKQEEKLLFLLASNEILTYEELEKQGISENAAKTIKFRLADKSRLKINTRRKVGFELVDEVYFTGGKEGWKKFK